MALCLRNTGVLLSPIFTINEKNRQLRSCVVVRNTGSENSAIVLMDPVRNSGASFVKKKGIDEASYDDREKDTRQNGLLELEPLWDDGYGTQTMKDYAEISMGLVKSAEGPPRWFCPVVCGKPLKDSPLLLYLPGIDGTGAGLVVHEKALGKVFYVQCLHIPIRDRTTLEGLFEIVEQTVMTEHTLCPNKPIYLLGESFGGALALAVAARNPTIDLILVLANPATSYERSNLHPIDGLVNALPNEYYRIKPLILCHNLGDYVKMLTVGMDIPNNSSSLFQLFGGLAEDIALLPRVVNLFPNDTFEWRLKLVASVAAYANSRLHSITAQVLVLASGKDQLLPSTSEAQRLSEKLKHCIVRVFEENGHAILLESGLNLLSAIKTTQIYHRFSKRDIINDFLPMSITECKSLAVENWFYRLFMNAIFFSTMEDGKIVRGLSGIPNEGPVLIVGNHMLMGIDLFPLLLEFLREKKVVLHGLAHPELFNFNHEDDQFMMHSTNILKLTGVVPVYGRNLFRLLANNSFTLLYPGGLREALHRKGECYKLFWPEKQEFVRMAVKLGATIIPYGGVGEDDLSEMIIDYNDIKRTPFVNQMWDEFNHGRTQLRKEMGGEIARQQFHIPVSIPKIPGRLYYMFGKPIRTKGMEKMLDDQDYLQELYSTIKCEIEKNVAYLLKKREEDPYKGVVERIMWQMKNGTSSKIPSFEP